MLRILKPIAAGLALAYLATAFVDKPAPVHFQPDNPYASKQAEIVGLQAEIVMEKNIMKLGSPLSVQPDEVVINNDAGELSGPKDEMEIGGTPVIQDSAADNATPSIKGEVEEIPES